MLKEATSLPFSRRTAFGFISVDKSLIGESFSLIVISDYEQIEIWKGKGHVFWAKQRYDTGNNFSEKTDDKRIVFNAREFGLLYQKGTFFDVREVADFTDANMRRQAFDAAIKMCADLKDLKDSVASLASKLGIGTHDNAEEENDNDN